MNPGDTILNKYRIEKLLGRGAFAEVYLVTHLELRSMRAIKVLRRHAEGLGSREFQDFDDRFRLEAMLGSQINNPSVVRVYDFERDGETLLLVMEYCSGGSLADVMLKLKQQGEVLGFEQAVQIGIQVGEGLGALHKIEAVHRDLKPSNILFDANGKAKISDLGLVEVPGGPSMRSQLSGAVLHPGTPGYMSPEQKTSRDILPAASDVYALGLVLFEALSGRSYSRQRPGTRLSILRSGTPAWLDDLLLRMLAENPKVRPWDGTEASGLMRQGEMAAAYERQAQARRKVQEEVEARRKEQADHQASETRAAAESRALAQAQEIERQRQAELTRQQSEQAAIRRSAEARQKQHRLLIPWLFVAGLLASLLLIGLMLGVWIVSQLPVFQASRMPMPTMTQAKKALELSIPTPDSTETMAQAPNTQKNSTLIPDPTATMVEVTNTPKPPTSTSEPNAISTSNAILIGGADKIAFLSNNEIWTANLDGSELIKLTTDGSVKNGLQWMPDGNQLVFINGKCIKTVEYPSGRQDLITCFNSAAVLNDFRISPDGTQVAISIDNEFLYVVPFEIEKLKTVTKREEIGPLGPCTRLSPYNANLLIKSVRWGFDSKSLAFVFAAPINGRREDTIRMIDISKCYDIFPRIGVEFPTPWFTIKGWDTNPTIPPFGWNGKELFVLNGMVRNGGFGDLYIFNNDLTRSQTEVNPIDNSCCYRDAQFSPDGYYLIFAYQAISAENKIQLFLIPVGTLDTGEKYTPIPLPDTFFSERDASPQPVFRYVIP